MKLIRPLSFFATVLVLASAGTLASRCATASSATPRWERTALEAAFEVDSEREWPALDSRIVSDRGNEVIPERFRARASVLLEGLADLAPEVSHQPREDFARTVRGLESLRLRVAAKAGYVNALFADSIDRVLWVAYAERLVSERALDPEVAQGIAALRGRTLDLARFAEVVRREGRREQGRAPLLEGTPVERFGRLAEIVAGPLGFESLLKDSTPATLSTFRLLDHPDLGALLFRLWSTDRVTHLGLPLLAELYARERGFEASPAADVRLEQVRQTLALSESDLALYGSPLHRATATVIYDVSELLDAAARGTLRTFSSFDSDLSPKSAPTARAADPGDGKR